MLLRRNKNQRHNLSLKLLPALEAASLIRPLRGQTHLLAGRPIIVFVLLVFSVSVLLLSFPFRRRASAQTDTFTTSGTWSVPAGVTTADFEAWGAGGAGAGSSVGSNGQGGGAGGQYAIKHLSGLNVSDIYTMTVAVVNPGSSGSGSAGGDSGVVDPSSNQVVLAKGGAGGSIAGGARGSTAGGVGDTVYAGGDGAFGGTTWSGGGGGGAGSSGNGGNASTSNAGTGTSSNGGNGGAGLTSNGSGGSGSNYGGGGAGAFRSKGPTQNGGDGAQGVVTVTYTIVVNSPPSSPTVVSPPDGGIMLSITGPIVITSSDPENDNIVYDISLYDSATNSGVSCLGTFEGEYIQENGDPGWDNGTTPYSSGANASFTIPFNLVRGNSYCWVARAKDPSGSGTYSSYSTPMTFTVDSAPSTPSLASPSAGATGVSTTPSFSFSDTDPDSDDIQFKINLFQSDCSTAVTTYDMASGQSGWATTFNGTAGLGLTYTSATAGSGVSFTPGSALTGSTTYCWSVSAKDPDGSNTFTTSGTQSFTTASAGPTDQVNIGGGVNITGGTNIY